MNIKEKTTKFIKRYFNTDELSIRLVLFNVIASAGLIGGTISLIITAVIGMGILQMISIAAAIVALFISFRAANERGKIAEAAAAVVGVITILLFPVMYFTGCSYFR